MTMDSGGERPDEADDQPSEEVDGWYFNLPGGAWERQEEKNRELRERVHKNLETPSPRADPFSAPKEDEKRGFFGRGTKQEEESEEHTTAGGTFRLAAGGTDAPAPRAESIEDDGDWSTEPVVPLRRRAQNEAPLPLPSTEWTADDDGPGEDIVSSMRKWSTSSAGDAEPAPHRELPPQKVSSWLGRDDEPKADESSADGPFTQPIAPITSLPVTFRLKRPERDEPQEDVPSRWKETFSSTAEESGGLAAMRQWAESGPVVPPREETTDEATEIPEEFLKPFDWESDDTNPPTAANVPAEFLKPFEWETEAAPAAAEPLEEVLPEPEALPESTAATLDELDDLFARRTEEAPAPPKGENVEEKSGGFVERLFGRKKQHAATPPSEASASGARSQDLGWVNEGESPQDAGWLPAEDATAPLAEVPSPEGEPVAKENPWRWPSVSGTPADGERPEFEAALSEPSLPEAVAEENPWKWPTETPAEAAEEVAPAFEVEVPEAEPVAEENPWKWPTETPAEVAEEAASAFEVEALEAEAVAEENPWKWPSETPAEVAEEAAPAFEVELPEAEPVAGENPWKWPSETPAEVAEEVAPAFEVEALQGEPVVEANPWKWPTAAPAEVVEQPAPAFATVVPPANDADDDAWNPEPFDAPRALRPEYALASAAAQPEPEVEPTDEFTFSFEPEDGEQERIVAPSAWIAPVTLSAPEQAGEERPWWETDEESAPEIAASTAQPVTSLKTQDAPAVAFPVAPRITPTADEDPWEEVSNVEIETPPGVVAESAPEAQDDAADPWAEFVPEPDPATVPAIPSIASLAEDRTFSFEAPSAAPPESVETDRPAANWESEHEESPATPASSFFDAPAAEVELDLASSLESQMAIADDEKLQNSRWAAAAANVTTEGGSATTADGREMWEDDEDVVLRAFNAHAATPEPELEPIDRDRQRAEDAAFNDLLGAGAADIVAEAADEEEPARSFLSPTPWVGSRRDTPENPFDAPWEADEGEALAYRAPVTDLRPAGGGGANGPWGTNFSFDDDGGTAAAAHPRHDRTKTVVREVVETVMLALLVFLCVRASFQNFKVDGSSMYPTLENGQFLIVNKLVYSEVDMGKLSNFIPLISASEGEKRNVFHGPDRGDIVVLQDPRKPEVDLIKRVIGLPGETLEIVDGKVYINDFRLEEPYIKAIWHDNKPKIVVPPGQYFVMGDNRDNSLDSRSQQVGFVPKELIIGKAMVSYWPKSKFGFAPNEAGNISTQDGVPKVTAQTVDEARKGR